MSEPPLPRSTCREHATIAHGADVEREGSHDAADEELAFEAARLDRSRIASSYVDRRKTARVEDVGAGQVASHLLAIRGRDLGGRLDGVDAESRLDAEVERCVAHVEDESSG